MVSTIMMWCCLKIRRVPGYSRASGILRAPITSGLGLLRSALKYPFSLYDLFPDIYSAIGTSFIVLIQSLLHLSVQRDLSLHPQRNCTGKDSDHNHVIAITCRYRHSDASTTRQA